MSNPFEVIIPLLNPNEPESRLSELHVENGERVQQGVVLCMLETTKSNAELIAEMEGYVIGLGTRVGDMVRAGARLCWIADEKDWQPPALEHVSEPSIEGGLPEGLRITEPALAMAQQADLDLSLLPPGPLITQNVIREVITREHEMIYELPEGPFEPNALIIYGGGGHGKSLIDLVRAMGTYQIVGIVDDGLDAGSEIMGLPIFGGGSLLSELMDRGLRLAVNAVGGIGDIRSRVKVFDRIRNAGFTCPTLIHPLAYVEPSAQLADSVQVFPNAYIGSEAEVGFGVIVNTGAIVSHDCRLHDHANVAPGASLAGGVTVGEGALIGMGVTINLNVEIGAGARVGNSAVVKQDVPQGAIVHAGAVWPSS
jgi:sugar O-acyltransferase (sialic acid O-acetyltransferase NeuD family)